MIDFHINTTTKETSVRTTLQYSLKLVRYLYERALCDIINRRGLAIELLSGPNRRGQCLVGETPEKRTLFYRVIFVDKRINWSNPSCLSLLIFVPRILPTAARIIF